VAEQQDTIVITSEASGEVTPAAQQPDAVEATEAQEPSDG
jgi:hypothetical protein